MSKIEVCFILKINNESVIEISEIKQGKTVLTSELEFNGYDLIRLDQSRGDGGVACFIKILIAYCYKKKVSVLTLKVLLLKFICLTPS